jgi:alcohol dehydrogenase (NADP+)
MELMTVGHEIAGKAIKVGPKVKSIKVGDRVGVGAQVFACLECRIV